MHHRHELARACRLVTGTLTKTLKLPRRGRKSGMDVLVVDDEALVREVVTEGLADGGLAVAEAPSAEHALALTETSGAPEVVVTDVDLGRGMNGLALAEEVHRRWPDAGV